MQKQNILNHFVARLSTLCNYCGGWSASFIAQDTHRTCSLYHSHLHWLQHGPFMYTAPCQRFHIELLWLRLNQFVCRNFCLLKVFQLKWCHFTSCSGVKLFIYPTLVKPWAAPCYQWMTWAVDSTVWIACWEILLSTYFQEASTCYNMYSMCSAGTAHAEGINWCVHIQYSVWQNGASAIQTMHRLQLWKLKISAGWVGFFCQKRTFSIGRWMMEK